MKHQITAVNFFVIWRFLNSYNSVRWLLWLRPTLLHYKVITFSAISLKQHHVYFPSVDYTQQWEMRMQDKQGKSFHATERVVGLEFQFVWILMNFVWYLITWQDSYQLLKKASDKNPGMQSRTTTKAIPGIRGAMRSSFEGTHGNRSVCWKLLLTCSLIRNSSTSVCPKS